MSWHIHPPAEEPPSRRTAAALRIPGPWRSHTPLPHTHTLSLSLSVFPPSHAYTHLHRCCSTYSASAGGGERKSEEVAVVVGGSRRNDWKDWKRKREKMTNRGAFC